MRLWLLSSRILVFSHMKGKKKKEEEKKKKIANTFLPGQISALYKIEIFVFSK